MSIIDLLEKETGEHFTIYEETPEEQIAMGVSKFLVEMRSMLLDGRGLVTRGGTKLWNDEFPEVKPMTLEEVVKQCVKELSQSLSRQS